MNNPDLEKDTLIGSVSNYLVGDAKIKWASYVNNYFVNDESKKKIKAVANLLGMVKANASKMEIENKLRSLFPETDSRTITEVLTIVNVFSPDVLRDLNKPIKNSANIAEEVTEELTQDYPELTEENIIDTGNNEKVYFDSNINIKKNAALTVFKFILENQDKLTNGDSTEFVLDTLSAVHDNWVENNLDEKTYKQKLANNETYLYTPLELAGYNTAAKYYDMVKPIFNMINVDVTDSLEDAYYNRAEKYLDDKNIKGIDDLGNLIKQGSNYYPALKNKSNSIDGMFVEGDFNISDAINQRLLFSTVKVVDNWKNNDPRLFRLFNVKRGITEENSAPGFGGLK